MSSHLKGVKKSTMTEEMRDSLIEYHKENPSLTQTQLKDWVKTMFNLQVNQATISYTIKRSSNFLDSKIEKSVERHKPAKFPELEKVLYEWFVQYQERVNMTGELITEKLKDFLKKMYPVDTREFHFSHGWLKGFKSRHDIKTCRRFGETGSVDMDVTESNLESIRQKLDQFTMKYVFNMDETDLFYKLQANHSLATKQLECKKNDKERITVVICCNEDGSKKNPLWFIGKYAKPRCFKNVNMSSLNWEYSANKRAWMTGILFQEYVQQLHKKIEGRKVLLIVDNYPAHPNHVEGLQNVELFFLPPNNNNNIKALVLK
ncbi:hypothetical protein OROGR_032848 [Orobanche gracilis]